MKKQTQAHKFKKFYEYFTPMDIIQAYRHFLWIPECENGNLVFPDGSVFVVKDEVEE